MRYVRQGWLDVCDVTCVTWRVWRDMCAVTCVTRHYDVSDVTHAYVGHDSLVGVTYFMDMCDMIHWCVWRDSLSYITLRISANKINRQWTFTLFFFGEIILQSVFYDCNITENNNSHTEAVEYHVVYETQKVYIYIVILHTQISQNSNNSHTEAVDYLTLCASMQHTASVAVSCGVLQWLAVFYAMNLPKKIHSYTDVVECHFVCKTHKVCVYI